MTAPAGALLTRRISCRDDAASLLHREWLVTNGLGGYASGTLGGTPTRRYHGLLMAALPAPFGRTLVLGPLLETARTAAGEQRLSELTFSGRRDAAGGALAEFRLEMGLPVWTYQLGGAVLEKRVLMPHQMNTVLVRYRLLEGEGPLHLELTAVVPFRPCHAPVNQAPDGPLDFHAQGDRWEIVGPRSLPPLRLAIKGGAAALRLESQHFRDVYYRVEDARGYEAVGELCSPASFGVELTRTQPAHVIASTEDWARLDALPPEEMEHAEHERRRRLLVACGGADGVCAELVLAADQFLILPAGRDEEAARIRAEGDEPHTVVAGYPWFTDWGRDTMISLEGLTLTTGRHREAGCILRTFAHHVRDGLIPNFFPDGAEEGLYHTADATLWFFHALHRYTEVAGDRATLRILLPKLAEIVAHHVCGTRFGIGVDPQDGLLRQGQAGYALTWMDAKMGDWVVTPRRGKAVEINALWYNALCLLRGWREAEAGPELPFDLDALIEQARTSFNRRFWDPRTGHLFDVVDGEQGDDPACRPNQVLALALDHPILDRAHWRPVLEAVRQKLLTPVGLRSLAPGHPDYKGVYHGDLRSRDGAYHQGAVWPWLLGPFLDAWLRVYPDDRRGARRMLEGLIPHMDDACVGSVAEIFDAEPPHLPRGCVAQAWSVAELLRCWVKVSANV